MEEVKIEKLGSVTTLQGKVEAVTLNFDIDKLLELQEQYTTLKCECNTLWLFIESIKHGKSPIIPYFENEDLKQIAEIVNQDFKPIPNDEQEFDAALTPKQRAFLSTPVTCVGFSTRITTGLAYGEIKTLNDILFLTPTNLIRRCRYIGKKSIMEIRDLFDRNGIKWG